MEYYVHFSCLHYTILTFDENNVGFARTVNGPPTYMISLTIKVKSFITSISDAIKIEGSAMHAIHDSKSRLNVRENNGIYRSNQVFQNSTIRLLASVLKSIH